MTTVAATSPILEVKDLQTYFFTRTGTVKAVDGVSFELYPGETLGVVGESGSGKSMTALSIMGLVPGPAGRTVGGQILYNGEDLLQKSAAEMRSIRGKEICMILQDPMTSLNPVYTVGNQVIETLRQSDERRSSSLRARAIELLEKVKIPAADSRFANFPHQMSGGMRQRVVGAIAVAGAPNVLIADEATTSLDATIQYQYLALLKELQEETGMAIIFITHDFGHRRQNVRPGGGNVRGTHGRDCGRAGVVQQSPTPLHRSPDALGAQRGRGRGFPVLHRRATAGFGRFAAGLHLCRPLSLCL